MSVALAAPAALESGRILEPRPILEGSMYSRADSKPVGRRHPEGATDSMDSCLVV
jgi:hypothetical protein